MKEKIHKIIMENTVDMLIIIGTIFINVATYAINIIAGLYVTGISFLIAGIFIGLTTRK